MLKIYGVPISVHSRKALVTARYKGIEFENDPVVPFFPPEDWMSLSPTGLIPAISHDGFNLSDSNAICAYLQRLKPEPSVYPADDKQYGSALWIEQYATTVLFRRITHTLFGELVVKPKILRTGETDATVIEKVLQEDIPEIYSYLENWLVENHGADGYFVGDHLTVADIAVTAAIINNYYLGFEIDATAYPKLAAAFSVRISSEPFASALKGEIPFAEGMGLDCSFFG